MDGFKKVEMNMMARCIMTASLDPTGLVPYLFYGGRYKNIEQWHVLYWKAWTGPNGHWFCSRFYDKPVIVNEPVTRELVENYTTSKVFDYTGPGHVIETYELPGIVYEKPPASWVNV